MTGGRRQQIVNAARALLADDPHSTLAVRAVAERAGIGASTLRHYFPNQRALHEAIFAAALEAGPSDLRIHDSSLPARVRLRECLVQLPPPRLPPDPDATSTWVRALESAFGAGGPAEARSAWASYAVRTLDAIAGWLRVLADQGAIPAGQERRRARFLLTVIEGIALARIIPVARPTEREEDAVIDDALAAVLRDAPARSRPAHGSGLGTSTAFRPAAG